MLAKYFPHIPTLMGSVYELAGSGSTLILHKFSHLEEQTLFQKYAVTRNQWAALPPPHKLKESSHSCIVQRTRVFCIGVPPIFGMSFRSGLWRCSSSEIGA